MIKAYQSVSTNSAIGSDRSKEDLWKEVNVVMVEQGFENRGVESFRKRHRVVQQEMNDWTAIFRSVAGPKGTYKSGTILEDDIEAAEARWAGAAGKNFRKRKFKYLNFWKEIQGDPKFDSSVTSYLVKPLSRASAKALIAEKKRHNDSPKSSSSKHVPPSELRSPGSSNSFITPIAPLAAVNLIAELEGSSFGTVFGGSNMLFKPAAIVEITFPKLSFVFELEL